MKRIVSDEMMPVYHQYPSQTSPQGSFIEVDFREQVIIANWDPEVGGAVPAHVWHRIALRFPIRNSMTFDELNDLIDNVDPFATEAAECFDIVWNGSNHVGEYSEHAEELIGKISDLCESTFEEEPELEPWEASAWMETGDKALWLEEILTEDETLDEMAARVAAEARHANVYVEERYVKKWLENLLEEHENSQQDIDD